MPTQVVTVESITQRQVGAAKDKTIFELNAAGGQKFATFRPEVAEKGRSFQGGTAVVVYETQQKGDFVNYQWQDTQTVTGDVADSSQGSEGAASAATPAAAPLPPIYKAAPTTLPDAKSKAEWRAEHVSGDMRACIAIASSAFPLLEPGQGAITVRADDVLKLARHYFDAVQQAYGLSKSVNDPAPVSDDIPF